MTSFRDKLKEIRSSEVERTRHRVPLSDRQLGLDGTSDRHLAVRGELVHDIEKLMAEFVAEAPTFEIGHGFFEGKYELAMTYDEPFLEEGRGLRKHFSRVSFLLDPCHPDGSFAITTKITIRDRDLPKGLITGNLDKPEDLAAFRKFAEEQVLRFATEYFAGRPHPQAIPSTT